MIFDKLKSSTTAFHRLAEEKNFSNKLKDGTISKEEYVILLKRLYCFFSQAKIIADKYAGDTIIKGNLFEEKLTCLKNDLTELGSTDFNEHIVFDKLNYFDSIGFCYVPVGSMLGGKIIYNNLVKMEKNESIHLPVRFYESCKDTVIINWSEFTSHLNLIDVTHHNDILNGAKLSYLHFLYLCMLLQ
ncbi:MAG: biliverdin-producing heme oxygenase [Bacteroidota bacterium]|nr:biliverdin-producing heme oxygenase [Bacteroidota bacterium]